MNLDDLKRLIVLFRKIAIFLIINLIKMSLLLESVDTIEMSQKFAITISSISSTVTAFDTYFDFL
jgi:hypothetical protein